MQIAIAAKENNTIHQGHFGDSPFFDIYRIDGATLTLVERRKNPFLSEAEVEHGKVKGITGFLKDCDILAGRGFGMHSLKKLHQLGKKAWLVRHHTVQELLIDINLKQSEKIMQFNPESNKFEPMP